MDTILKEVILPVLTGVGVGGLISLEVVAYNRWGGQEYVLEIIPPDKDHNIFEVVTHPNRHATIENGYYPGSTAFWTVGEPRFRNGKPLEVGQRYSNFRLEMGGINKANVNQIIGR